MHEQIDVVYENGVLRPLGPLPYPLEEHQQLTVILESPTGKRKSASRSSQKAKRAKQVTPRGSDAEETAYDIASRAGLIGCLKSAPGSPTDLSTNPKHMEGFGRE